jgi:hypothetical protein
MEKGYRWTRRGKRHNSDKPGHTVTALGAVGSG